MKKKISVIVTTSVLAVMLAGASLTGCTCSGTTSAAEESTEATTEIVTKEAETSKTAKQTSTKETTATTAAESKSAKETSSAEQATSASSGSQKLTEAETQPATQAATQPATTAHTHSWYVSDSRDASCSQSGYVTYRCSCGEEWTDWTGATGHSYYVQSSGGGTSCTDASWTKYKCSACGDTYTDYGAAGGHNWVWVDTSYYVEGTSGYWVNQLTDAVICTICNADITDWNYDERVAHVIGHTGDYCSDKDDYLLMYTKCVGLYKDVWFKGTPGYTVSGGYYKCSVCGATK